MDEIPSEDDRPLIDRLRTGEQVALSVLHERHARAVYRTVHDLVGAADAEEVTQDAFILLWRKCRRIELDGISVLPWLLTAARYLAFNVMRSRGRRSRYVTELVEDMTVQMNTEDLAIASIQLARMEEKITSLPKADREVYSLCVVEGLSYKQVARRLQMTHAAVRNRLSRVRAALRTEIGQ